MRRIDTNPNQSFSLLSFDPSVPQLVYFALGGKSCGSV
jgi:hypothetical protein